MPYSGDACQVTGIYRCVCCKVIVFRIKGEMFGNCTDCDEPTPWELIASSAPARD